MSLDYEIFTPTFMKENGVFSQRKTDLEFSKLGFSYWQENGETCWDCHNIYTVPLSFYHKMNSAVKALNDVVLKTVDHICKNPDLMTKMEIPPSIIPDIIASWNNEQELRLLGRFDLAIQTDGSIKALEFNGDTPTTLIESALVQPAVIRNYIKAHGTDKRFCRDTINGDRIRPLMVASLFKLRQKLRSETLHLAACTESKEDLSHISLYRIFAELAGFSTSSLDMSDIGLDDGDEKIFYDKAMRQIKCLYTLYPWEFIFEDEFGSALLQSWRDKKIQCIEPLWKHLASNKGLFAVAYKLFPGHPNLLPTFFSDDPDAKSLRSQKFVSKPMVGREGQNIKIVESDGSMVSSDGTYFGKNILQKYATLPVLNNKHTVIGGWIINDCPAGFLVRSDRNSIIQNSSMSAALAIIND